MTDSERLNSRLDAASRRRPAKTGGPAPIGDTLPQNIFELARKHVVDPAKIRFATDAEIARKDEEIRRERLERKAEIMLARLPSRYRQADYIAGSYGMQAARWVSDYRYKGTRKSLVIMGTVGTGKTWLAAAIARDLMVNTDRPVPVTFITVADMIDLLRTARPGMDVDMAQFANAPVLVLDDLGSEYQTEWSRAQMYRLSHARYHDGLPTIVTTNLKGQEIHDTYEARTVQRLFGGAAKIDMVGESRRTLPF
jgi:DNA replication protein DnaC